MGGPIIVHSTGEMYYQWCSKEVTLTTTNLEDNLSVTITTTLRMLLSRTTGYLYGDSFRRDVSSGS